VTKPEPPSAFVKRCQDALAEYQRLRFLGAGHEVASRKLREALRGRDVDGGASQAVSNLDNQVNHESV
jgi:hypothetical protein